MFAYFKKLQKKEIKKLRLESYLIIISGRPNEFIPDDQFDKTIIILNKKNITLSVN